ncbi:MAG: carbohydrate ABC transporter permease [Firmicutes bacterium]|nr:carbohydrate ABC transporter permease [Bacillota bacterium]MCL5039340.1 carbohydrate ABC transporter permease [Bacillota bacterium]
MGAWVVVLPYLWMITTSLKPLKLTFSPPYLLPVWFQWENYRAAWEAAPFARYYLNSAIMAAAIAIGQVLGGAMAAYAFDRLNFRFKEPLFLLFLGTLMIPFHLQVIPSYLIIQRLGWLNTYAGLIIPRLISAFGVFLMRQFFRTIPRELDEAAMIDGCGRLCILFRILLPVARPAVTALGLFAFLFGWNDFLWPLIVTTDPNMQTIQVGLATFYGKYGTQWVYLMAGTVTSTLPVLGLFILAQRWIIEGVTMGSLKE